uniref:No apical meristem-associated C-terminal domain-containing protein n=1 Tax=Setaria italica TaxID=4555 RepID=K3ZET6_SETIT
MTTERKEKKQEDKARWMEVKAMEERKVIEERKVVVEECKVVIEEEKLQQKIMFVDTSCLDDEQKAFGSAMHA